MIHIPAWWLPYSENPGIPIEEERGIYCPEGIKIAKIDDASGAYVIDEPWDDDHASWCTPERFVRELAEMTRELAEADADLARNHYGTEV